MSKKVNVADLRLDLGFDRKDEGFSIYISGDTYKLNQRIPLRMRGWLYEKYLGWWCKVEAELLENRDALTMLERYLKEQLDGKPAARFADWLREQPQQVAEPAEPVEFVPPVQLLPHQKEAVRRILRMYAAGHKGFLLADAPRVGKTYTILATLRILGKPALILAPASVVGMWRREMERWGVAGEAMSYEAFRSRGFSGEADIVVLDEAHKVKNSKAAITKKVKDFCKGRFVIAATGTPFQNNPLEFQTILNIAGLPARELIGSGMKVERNRWGGVDAYWVSSRLAEVRKRLESHPQYLRRELADVAQYLPKLSRQVLEAEGAAWAKVLQQVDAELERLEAQYRAEGKDDRADKVAAVRSGVFGEDDLGALFPIMSSLRALLGEAKTGFALEVINDLIEQGEQFLIFTHHESVRDAIRSKLIDAAIPFGVISGDTMQSERQQLADAFQRGELRVFILSTRAAGEGLTLSRAAAAVFVELDWNPAVLTQAENRLLNVAEGGNKVIYYVIAPHPLERRMVDLVNQKAKDAEGVYAAEGSIAKLDGEVQVISVESDDDHDDDPDPTPTPEPTTDWWGVGEPSGWYTQPTDTSGDPEFEMHLPHPELPLWGAQPELWAGLPRNAGAEYIVPRIVREGVRGQGWKLQAPATTLRVRQLSQSIWAAYVGGAEACVGSEADVVAYLRSALPHLSLRKPGRDTVEFLLRHRLLELHPNPNRPRGRKRGVAWRSVDALPPREERVGFSEIAAVMGQSPFTTPLELWRVKVGLDEPKPETFAMRWGRETERIALKLFSEQVGAKQVKRHIKAADGVLAGEVDAIARINGEWCVVEIKVASGKHAHHAYRLQVNAQLGALGLRKGYIYTVFGTHADAEEVEFNPELYQQQKAAAEAFIQAVKNNTPPVPAEMLEARDEGLPELDLTEREGEAEAAMLLADIAELEKQVEPLSERLSELRDKLKLAMMTTNLRLIKTGFAIAEIKEVQSERLDTKALKQAHPDIAAQFVKQTSYTQLKLKLF